MPYMPAIGSAQTYSIRAMGERIEVDSPLKGAHQHRNLALAIAAAVELAENHGLPVTPAAIATGIRQTVWPARLERIHARGREWILDVAHNPAGAWALRAGLRDTLAHSPPRTLIFSCLRDKPIAEMAQILLPIFDRVIFAPIHSSRAAARSDLLAAADSTGTPAVAANSVPEALRLAAEAPEVAARGIVISGSVYLVGEARSLLLAGGDAQP